MTGLIRALPIDTDGTLAANSDTRIASQKAARTYVAAQIAAAIAALVNSSPATLDTLKELADALGDDPNFATTVAASIGAKLNSSAVSAYGLTLIDDADAATARATLGALASSAASAFGLSLIDDADAATARATLGALASSAASAFGLTLIDDADAATARATLGAAAPEANTFGTEGSSTLPGGLILKWGTTGTLSAETANQTVTFATAFPTACHNVVAVPGSANGAVGGSVLNSSSVHTPSTTGFKVDNDGVASAFSWQAIGH